jgi:hypothetical protein
MDGDGDGDDYNSHPIIFSIYVFSSDSFLSAFVLMIFSRRKWKVLDDSWSFCFT